MISEGKRRELIANCLLFCLTFIISGSLEEGDERERRAQLLSRPQMMG